MASTVNGLALLALIVLPLVAVAAYRLGAVRARPLRDLATAASPSTALPSTKPVTAQAPTVPPATPPPAADALRDELSRLVRSYEAEAWALRSEVSRERATASTQLGEARAEAARYRRIVVDIENNAPPPLFDEPGTPDDLKLIVGIGPVLERMLHQLGVGSYRQIARWSEQDIDAIDARLPEFPGRIRRDGWVTQARELHAAKYGERP